MSDILQEIPDEQLPALRDLFKPDWPYAIHAYYWVDNYIDWKKRGITNIKFFCPDGLWDDGTFIAVQDDHTYAIFIFTLEKSCERLKNALANSSILKLNEKNLFMYFLAVHEAQHCTLINLLKSKDIDITHQDIANMWWITKEDAVKYNYEIPPDVYLAPLQEKDVNKIDSIWPHRGKTSKLYLSSLINYNGGFGIFLKKDDTLVSWIMRNDYGGLAILQTVDDYKRKGFGALLTKHFSKYWGEKSLDIFCFIMKHNKASIALYEKLGWKREHGITWFQCNTK